MTPAAPTLAGRRVLVTGGSGFIGTNLLQHLADHGAQVCNADIAPPRNPAHAGWWQPVDVREPTALRECLSQFQPEWVVHLGARTDLEGASLSDYDANTVGVERLIDALAAQASVRRVVFASSRLVCRIGYQPRADDDYCPTTAYGESKAQGEQIVRRRCADAPYGWLILRPTSIWGPWFDVPYKTFFLSVAGGRYVHPQGVAIQKSFGFVGNTVHQLCTVLSVPAEAVQGRTLYLADYPPIEVSALAVQVQQACGARPVRQVPLALLRTLAAAGDLAKVLGLRNPPLTRFRLDNLLTPMVHDLSPLQALCGPLPFGMAQGVASTVAWLRAQGQVA